MRCERQVFTLVQPRGGMTCINDRVRSTVPLTTFTTSSREQKPQKSKEKKNPTQKTTYEQNLMNFSEGWMSVNFSAQRSDTISFPFDHVHSYNRSGWD